MRQRPPVFGLRLFDANFQIVPCRLAGDGIGIGVTPAVVLFRQQFVDQVVEQEPLGDVGGRGVDVPGARAFADGVPGPHRPGVDPGHHLYLHLDAPGPALGPHPVVVFEARLFGDGFGNIEPIGTVNLPEPGILGAPGMVHGHGTLGDRVKGIGLRAGRRLVQRLIPERQRIEVGLDTVPLALGRDVVPVAAGGEPELLQRLAVEPADHRIGGFHEALFPGIGEIAVVDVAEELVLAGKLFPPVTAVLYIFVQLVRVGRALPGLRAVLAPPAGQRADPRLAFMVDDVVRIAARIGRTAHFLDKSRQTQPGAQVDQHVLERPHVPVGLDHRLADGIGCSVGVADRPIEKRDAVPALEVGGVREDQVRVGHGLRIVGVRVDDVGDFVAAARLVLVGEHLQGSRGVHGRVPRHVGHVHEQHFDGVRIAPPGIADNHVHQPVRRQRRLPRERLVDPHGRAVLVHQQVLGALGKAQVRSRKRQVGVNVPGTAGGPGQ